MRIILKPAGALIVIGCIVALSALCYRSFFKYQTLALFQEGSITNGEQLVTGAHADKDLVRAPRAGELVSPDMQRWNMVAFLPARAKRKFVTFENPPWTGNNHGMRISIAAVNPATGSKSVELVKAIPVELKEGTSVGIQFWARSTSEATMDVSLTEGDSSQDAFKEVITVPKTWKRYSFGFVSKHSYTPGQLAFIYRMGTAPGEVELAQVNLSTN